ncbi:hypothetical protein, variant [Aphanomyces astaci]|uniref:Uncharacterized protein n=1 Tax=Aphanomyces astaci TaxID=112090 RepID=W4G153_APHAT|nr:hypothetical protein, variant [Aphanomyces astaci]ETV72769.1 hypothetical protein, variant [Aphanomyces astaci]|eukprot:XP_009837555.1 hypothetical protein, variant [Aphanomyces astaci]
MGSGSSKPMDKPAANWTPINLSEYVNQSAVSNDAKAAIGAWVTDNAITGPQLLDMDTGMVLAQLRLPDGDAPHVATFLSELRTLAATESATAAIHTTLKGLPAALEKAVYVYEKYPLIIDETGQAAQFFKYQRGCFLMAGNPADVTESVLRRSLVAALRLGTTMTLCLDKLAGLELDQFFSDGWFPSQVLNRHEFSKPEGEGDPDASLFLPSDAFKFVVLCGNIPPPPRTLERMCLIRVQSQDTMKDSQDDTAGGGVAAALGLREVIRNSGEVVEAGFDGDVAAMTALLTKGFHVESEDGHRHTALSEAACQGHVEMLQCLLSLGANPNVVNDTGRSPLFRASYNGHLDAVTLLLHAGADPRISTTQGETPFDVAKGKDIAEMLTAWPVATTDRLLKERRELMEKKLQERLTSHVEREHVAKLRIRDDLVALASSTASTAAGELKAMLLGLAADAVVNADKPRGSANSRDERGCTLLALAAQHDNADVATLLLTHWKQFQDDSHPVVRKAPHAKDTYIDVFRAQVNARDMKGWTPVAIAVFHQAKRTTRLLLQHGANPRLKNQYNKSAMDFAQDELDAAMNVVTSRAEIRSVLDEWESEQLASTLENNRNKFSVGAAEPLPSDGGATLLAIEVAEEAQQKASSKKKVPGKKTKSKKTK